MPLICWPFHIKTAPAFRKFDPFTVSVNPGPPAITVDGEIEVSVTKNCALWPPVAPRLPQPARKQQKIRVAIKSNLRDLFMCSSSRLKSLPIYCVIVIVSVAVWFTDPPALLEAETDTVLVPGGVPLLLPWLLLLLLLPPQDANTQATTMSRNKPNNAVRRLFLRSLKMTPVISRNVGSSAAKTGLRCKSPGTRIAALFAVVFTVSVLVTALPFGVTEVGLKVQVASAGNPVHAKLTAELNPFRGVTVNVAVPLFP